MSSKPKPKYFKLVQGGAFDYERLLRAGKIRKLEDVIADNRELLTKLKNKTFITKLDDPNFLKSLKYEIERYMWIKELRKNDPNKSEIIASLQLTSKMAEDLEKHLEKQDYTTLCYLLYCDDRTERQAAMEKYQSLIKDLRWLVKHSLTAEGNVPEKRHRKKSSPSQIELILRIQEVFKKFGLRVTKTTIDYKGIFELCIYLLLIACKEGISNSQIHNLVNIALPKKPSK